MKDYRATLALTAVLWLTVIVVLAVVMGVVRVPSAHSADRLYPYTGLRYRMQEGETPKLRAELGVAFSAGRLAPAVTGSLGLDGRLSPGLDVSLRWKL